MVLQSHNNLFPGVNPLLNSFLQQPDGGWESFHFELINAISHHLDELLPDNYYAIADKGLQIDEDDYLVSVNIFEAVAGKLRGKLITSIEILSPANKPGSHYHPHYLVKRVQLLRSQVNLVEIDFLHETAPVISHIPSYPDDDDHAYPYTIAISKPHPSVDEGEFALYGTGVDEALSPINIPLAGTDIITLEIQAAYNRAFSGLRVFASLVDYEQQPANFERYRGRDRQTISARLAIIRG